MGAQNHISNASISEVGNTSGIFALRDLLNIQWERARVIIVLSFWPKKPRFPILVQMVGVPPWFFPINNDLLLQG